MNRLLFVALVALSCSDKIDSVRKLAPNECLVLDGIVELRALEVDGINAHYQEVEIRDSMPIVISNNDIETLHKIGCNRLMIISDSVTITTGKNRADSISSLVIRTNVLQTECPIVLRFPGLQFIKLEIDNPSFSNFFNQGFETNTLFVIGKYSSTSFLTESSCHGAQLILESNSLINIDSLHINKLKFNTINIQLTPLSSRLDSIYPVHEDIYGSLNVTDSTVLVY